MTDRSEPEATLREGLPTRPIRLSDGKFWRFARPTLRFVPRVRVGPDEFGRPVETITVEMSVGYPPEIERLYRGLRLASANGTPPEQYSAFFMFAAALLRLAHDVDLPTACTLLTVGADDLPRLVRDVMAV